MLSALALLGVVTACGGTGDGPDEPDAPTSEQQSSTAASPSIGEPTESQPTESQPDESQRSGDAEAEAPAEPDGPCDAGEQAEWLDLADDGSPDAFQIGSGEAAVILLHQNDGRACAWVPFAQSLADQGYAVLVPVMRPGRWPQPVIGLAAEHLRADGATHLGLVGASMGGTYAIAATPELKPAPDVVVAVSAPDFYKGSSARDAIADLALPTLFVVAEHDTGFVPDAESLAAAAQDSELMVLGDATAHGILLLDQEPEAAAAVQDTLQEHLAADAEPDD